MMYQPDPATMAGPSQIRWRGSDDSNRLDCETGVLLRRLLEPIFDRSGCWDSLRQQLKDKGFELAFNAGRLVLVDQDSGARICSCKFLGYPLTTLTERFGRPKILASSNGQGCGRFLD